MRWIPAFAEMAGEVAGMTYIGGASVCPQSPNAVSFKQTRYYVMYRDLSLGKWPPDLYTEPRWPGMLLAQR